MNIEFKDNSEQVLAALHEAISEALQGIGDAAEKHAKATAPVDTGNLRDHIRHMVDDGKQTVYIGTYDKEVPYAQHVEIGTHKMAAQPFLKPAIANHKREYKQIIEDALKDKGL